jgi:hypothetical protein
MIMIADIIPVQIVNPVNFSLGWDMYIGFETSGASVIDLNKGRKGGSWHPERLAVKINNHA